MLIELLEDIRDGEKLKATHGNVFRRRDGGYAPVLDRRFKAAWRAGLIVEAEQPEAEALIAEGKAKTP
jgi:hypothetical protein